MTPREIKFAVTIASRYKNAEMSASKAAQFINDVHHALFDGLLTEEEIKTLRDAERVLLKICENTSEYKAVEAIKEFA